MSNTEINTDGLFEVLGTPELVSISNPDLLIPNPLNPRDGKKGTEDLVLNIRTRGFKVWEDMATGRKSLPLAFRDPEHPEKLILLRGHRRAGALRKIQAEDANAEKVAARPKDFKSFTDILREAAQEFDLDQPGIPVLVLPEAPSKKHQLELILDEDTSQVKKSSRQQFSLWQELVAEGYTPEKASQALGYNTRVMAFAHASAVTTPKAVAEAWVKGGGGKDSNEPRMTDADLRAIHDAYKKENKGEAEPGSGDKAFADWKTRATGEGQIAVARPASPKMLKELANVFAARNMPPIVMKVLEYAIGARRDSPSIFTPVVAAKTEAEIKALLEEYSFHTDESGEEAAA